MTTLPDLPVSPFIPQIAETLKNSTSRFLILTAETGAGKSTVIPAGLADFFNGKILVTEPRRIAALSIAERVSEILDEECGKKCGYKIHLENKVSSETQIEIVTEAILSRTLQNDPSLEGYSVIILDEFHERSLTTDLNLAFLREAMELRDDLYVIIMSATMDTAHLSEYLSKNHEKSDVPVMEIPGRTFPVEVEYKPGTDIVTAILEELNFTDRKSGKSEDGSKVILGFLPGIKEIRRAEAELSETLKKKDDINTEIFILHSSISLSDQKKIFTPLSEKTNRIIISSAIAETSLTVPGVTTVIDSGLSRVNRLNIALGMESLFTENESDFSAEQRKGRAGRTQKGRCVRLWSKNDPRQKSMLPEILRSDISSLVLECAAWGKNISETEDFFLDSPSKAGIKTATEFLQNMKFLDAEKKITERGRTALECAISPRLANIILFAAENDNLENEAVSLILKYSDYSESKSELQRKFCDDIKTKILRTRKKSDTKQSGTSTRAALLFSGFSDRLAKKQVESNLEISKQNPRISYQFPNGHSAVLSENLSFNQAPSWIIAPDILATNTGGTIFHYESLSEVEAESLISNYLHEETECFFNEDKTKISKFVYTKYGKITLFEKKVPVTKDDFLPAWCTQIHQKGLNSLNLSHKTKDFLVRAQFFAIHNKNGCTDILQKYSSVMDRLEAEAEEWLTPFLNDGKLTDEIVYDAIYWYLNGSEIDNAVPVQITLPNGRKTRIFYEQNSSPEDKTKLIIRPVIEIIIQRIFGCFENPEIMGVPVLLKLLSPASRPLQITDDLAGFWNGTWIEICKEMKGRYPKHNWDYRVAEKE